MRTAASMKSRKVFNPMVLRPPKNRAWIDIMTRPSKPVSPAARRAQRLAVNDDELHPDDLRSDGDRLRNGGARPASRKISTHPPPPGMTFVGCITIAVRGIGLARVHRNHISPRTADRAPRNGWREMCSRTSPDPSDAAVSVPNSQAYRNGGGGSGLMVYACVPPTPY